MISVIIPVFNAKATLGKCLAGLQKQILKPKEIIIVNDGSKENIRAEVSRIRSELGVKNLVFLNQRHLGVSEARNLGAKKAHGEILAFIDSDCIPPNDWLKKIETAFLDPKVGAVGGGYSFGIDNSFWQRYSVEELAFRRRKMKGLVTTLLSNNMACRKNCFLEAGGFPKQFPVCEDMYLSYQISHRYKVLWLKNNGVKHHFKKNLVDFLKHQHFFGKESTKFFLYNPKILFDNNHQGRQLHFAIMTASLSIIFIMIAPLSFMLGNSVWASIAFKGAVGMLVLHYLLYWGLIVYLNMKKFSLLEIARAYFVSYIRDLVVSISFLEGFTVYITDRSAYNT